MSVEYSTKNRCTDAHGQTFHFPFQLCIHADGLYEDGSRFFYIASNLLTFVIPVILLFIPWWALLVQLFGCCTRKLRSATKQFKQAGRQAGRMQFNEIGQNHM